jgi:hypothetical protein
VEAGDRKKAMEALLKDELANLSAQADKAIAGKTLPPFMALAQPLRDVHALEMQVTGDDKQSMALAQSLGDRMYSLINDEISRVGEQLKAIQRAASQVVDWGGGNFQSINGQTRWVPAPGSSGLTADQRQTLREAGAYLAKIADACDDVYAIARRYDREGRRWQEEAKAARDLRNFAEAVYDNE